jgi:peptidoglycan-associated lipoprotein
MRATWIAILAAALAACTSTPDKEQEPASVEDRQPGADAGPGGARTAPVTPGGVARVDLAAAKPSAAMLKDPSNILSKRSIYYEFDKFDVKDEYKALIEAHARYLRENPAAKMLIQGNTDERGSREYNVALGQRRSDGVRRMLMLLGAREDQIEAVSLGEEKPRAQGSDEAAWSQNRRSDMLYSGEY